jgi:hypothetical protein
LAAADAANLHRYTHYEDGYRANVQPRDYLLQLTFSFLGLILLVVLVLNGIQALVGVPVLTSQTFVSPSPEQVLSLYSELARVVDAEACPDLGAYLASASGGGGGGAGGG